MAKAHGNTGVSVTVGQSEDKDGMWPYAGTAAAIEAMGGKHVDKEVRAAF